VSVDPNLAVAINAIEVDEDKFAFRCCWHIEGLAIPADAAGQRAAAGARRVALIKFAFNAPIMRQIQLSPLCIIEIRILPIGNIAELKSPVLIEAHRLFGPWVGMGNETRKREQAKHD